MCLIPDAPKIPGPRAAPRAPDLEAVDARTDERARRRATLASMVTTQPGMGAAPTAGKPSLGA